MVYSIYILGVCLKAHLHKDRRTFYEKDRCAIARFADGIYSRRL